LFADKLYAVGGCDGSSSLESIEVFDPVLGEWRLGPNMTIPRSNVGVAVLEDRLYAVGGFSGNVDAWCVLSASYSIEGFRYRFAKKLSLKRHYNQLRYSVCGLKRREFQSGGGEIIEILLAPGFEHPQPSIHRGCNIIGYNYKDHRFDSEAG